MSIQHNAIADADRHENKGASTATIGQVLKANGDGTTTFVNPSTLSNVVTTTVLNSGDTTTQAPSTTDTAKQVTFGSAITGADVSLASDGTVTFNNSGFYEVTINLNFGRPTASGLITLLSRVLINGSALSPTYVEQFSDTLSTISREIVIQRSFTAGNTLTAQIVRDSGGTALNNGSLIPFTPVITGWAAVPSASILITKQVGVS